MKKLLCKIYYVLLIGAAIITGLGTILGLAMVFKSSDEFAAYWLTIFCGGLTYRIYMAATGVPNPFGDYEFSRNEYTHSFRHDQTSTAMPMTPSLNIDGTPMVEGSYVDVLGKSYGDSGEIYDPWNADRIHDTGMHWGSSNDFSGMGTSNLFDH